jgi:hypothetical protein
VSTSGYCNWGSTGVGLVGGSGMTATLYMNDNGFDGYAVYTQYGTGGGSWSTFNYLQQGATTLTYSVAQQQAYRFYVMYNDWNGRQWLQGGEWVYFGNGTRWC